MKKDTPTLCEFCNRRCNKKNNCVHCQNKITMQEKIKEVMHEFKEGTLFSGRGGKVVNRKQAVAIALNQARKKIKNKH